MKVQRKLLGNLSKLYAKGRQIKEQAIHKQTPKYYNGSMPTLYLCPLLKHFLKIVTIIYPALLLDCFCRLQSKIELVLQKLTN